jgi:hypothetical protein
MHHKISKRLMSSPKAMMDFQLRGKLPRLVNRPKSPLHQLLSSMTPMERSRFGPVKLSPKLGYNSSLTLNCEQMLRWLGGNEPFGEWEHRQCDSCRIASFTKKLTISDLSL